MLARWLACCAPEHQSMSCMHLIASVMRPCAPICVHVLLLRSHMVLVAMCFLITYTVAKTMKSNHYNCFRQQHRCMNATPHSISPSLYVQTMVVNVPPWRLGPPAEGPGGGGAGEGGMKGSGDINSDGDPKESRQSPKILGNAFTTYKYCTRP